MTVTAKNEHNFDHLPRYAKRRFVEQQVDLTDPKEAEIIFERLMERDIRSSKDLEQWVLDRSELETAIDQQGSILYIRMTCQTDDDMRVHK